MEKAVDGRELERAAKEDQKSTDTPSARPCTPSSQAEAGHKKTDDGVEEQRSVEQGEESVEPAVSGEDKSSPKADKAPRSPRKGRGGNKGSPSTQPSKSNVQVATRSPHPESHPPVLRLDSMIPGWFNKVSDASFPSTPKSVSMSSMRQLDSLSASMHSSAGPLSDSEQDEGDTGIQISENPDTSTSELVMPSIQMPSRRAFTERGRNLGSLTVLLTGPKREGKSSLIKALAQSTEDIVHIDYFPQEQDNDVEKEKKTKKSEDDRAQPQHRTEFHASTRPYPAWWSQEADHHVTKRRRTSTGDDLILDRNLHFLETRAEGTADIDSCITALERTLHSQRSSDPVSLRLLSNDTGTLIDLICYVTDKEPADAQADKLKRLSQLCNLVILLTHADLRNTEESDSLKSAWHSWLETHQIALVHLPPESPSSPPTQSTPSPSSTIPSIYSFSSAPSCTLESMDASLLMSSTPSLPSVPHPLLTPSDLPLLISQTLRPQAAAYLRHATARKFLTWRRRVLHPSDQTGGEGSHKLLSFEQYRAKEEREARERVGRWSEALRRRNVREREACERVARGERVSWLLERLGECARDGTMFGPESGRGGEEEEEKEEEQTGVKAAGTGKAGIGASHVLKGDRAERRRARRDGRAERRQRRRRRSDESGFGRHLARGLVLLQLVGSITVLGGAAIWLARQAGWDGELLAGF